MSDAVNKVISTLDAHGCQPKRSGKGWAARCPAHEDKSPSLSLSEGAEGRALLRCHAGCGVGAVLKALGLESGDLFADEPAGRRQIGSRSTTPAAKASTAAPLPRTVPSWRRALGNAIKDFGEPSHVHEYRDAEGRLVGIVARFETPDGKTFRQASTEDNGVTWTATKVPSPRPLYRLPAVLANDTVIVVEGERCADTLASLGFVVTTSAGGSKAAVESDWSPLAGKRAVIVPDHDDSGERYLNDVSRFAVEAGAASVSVVTLADHWQECPAAGDVADWIESFGDTAEPADMRAAFEKMLAAAEPMAVEAVEPEADEDDLTWVPFPTNQLPEPISAFVREGAAAIGADESMIALPMLSLLAGAIGNTRRLRIKAQWAVPPILWTAIVSESGSGKSPSLRLASAFIEEMQARAFARHETAMADYERRLQEHEVAMKRAASRNGASPGEKPEKPACRRLLVNDTTIEALVPILRDNPRGVVVLVDELAAFFTSMDAYRAAGRGALDRPKWLSMFDAGPVTVDRVAKGTAHVPSAAVCVTGGVQPAILRNILSPDAVTSGLVSRFIFAMPPRRRMRWSEDSVPFATMTATADLFALLVDGLGDSTIKTDGPKDLDLDPDARAEFARYADEVYARQEAASGATAAMLSKLTATAARIALVVHLVRQAGTEPTLGHRVDVESIRRGIAIAEWAGREQRRVYGMLLGDRGVDQDADDAETLRKWLAAHGGCATLREIRRGPKSLRDEARAAAAAERLVVEGRAVRETAATGGRPAQVVRLVEAAVP